MDVWFARQYRAHRDMHWFVCYPLMPMMAAKIGIERALEAD